MTTTNPSPPLQAPAHSSRESGALPNAAGGVSLNFETSTRSPAWTVAGYTHKANEETAMETKEAISIKAPNFQVASFKIRGTAPLVLHRFSKKGEIMAKQAEGQKANIRKTRSARDFDKDYRDAMYFSKDGWHGIPATSFRNAMIAACRVVGYKMTHARMAVFVEADGMDADSTPLVKILSGAPQRHEGYARNQTGVIDIRVRPMWQVWEADLRVKFDADMMSLTDVANLLQRAGIQSGVGEGRPNGKESGGCGWGTFELLQEAA